MHGDEDSPQGDGDEVFMDPDLAEVELTPQTEHLGMSTSGLAGATEAAYRAFVKRFRELSAQRDMPVPEHILQPLKDAEQAALSSNDPDIPRLFRVCHGERGDADLTHGNIGPIGTQLLASFCQGRGREKLREIRLDYNEMGDVGMEYLAEGLKGTPEPRVHTLSLDCNGICARGIAHLTRTFVGVSARLTQLLLNNNPIGDEGVRLIAESATRPGSAFRLQSLHLQQVGMGRRGARHMRDMLRECSSLNTLLLNRNPLGDEGAEAIAEGLQGNSTLRHLALADVSAGPRGAAALAAAYANPCCALQDMIVGPNPFGDEGAAAFGDALEKARGIREVVMPRSGIGDAGMRWLAHALLRNSMHGVNILHLEDNPASVESGTVSLWKKVLRPNLTIHLNSSMKVAPLKGRSHHDPGPHAAELLERERMHGRGPRPVNPYDHSAESPRPQRSGSQNQSRAPPLLYACQMAASPSTEMSPAFPPPAAHTDPAKSPGVQRPAPAAAPAPPTPPPAAPVPAAAAAPAPARAAGAPTPPAAETHSPYSAHEPDPAEVPLPVHPPKKSDGCCGDGCTVL